MLIFGIADVSRREKLIDDEKGQFILSRPHVPASIGVAINKERFAILFMQNSGKVYATGRFPYPALQ
jgi:hypothetical protein